MDRDKKFGSILIVITACFIIFCSATYYIRQSRDVKVVFDHADIVETQEMEIVKGDGALNINTATVEELMTLPGIGRDRAEKIIRFRESNGEFESITQLRLISGIGEKIFEDIRELITVGN